MAIWRIIFLVFIFLLPFFLFSQNDLEKKCLLEEIDNLCQKISSQDCRKLLEECERYYKEKGEELEKNIERTQKEKQTLKNKISSLRRKIESLDYQIYQTSLVIKDLNLQIRDTENSIQKTSLKIEELKKRLAQILRLVYEEDQRSIFEILLTENKISDFFDNLIKLENLHLENQEILKKIKKLKLSLEEQKNKLDEEKEDLAKRIKIKALQKEENQEVKKEKERLLKMTEAQYQQYLREKKELEKKTAEIMARIVQLTLPGLDIPKTPKELYELAKWAGQAAGGVRPALILVLLEVESALGVNVGQCNCQGQPVCRHPELNYKQVMSKKQWSAFETIVKELGLDINTTPVSCYVNGGKVQMGGAMGPAQFLPNTWLKLGYKERVENITLLKPANPWRAKDAFLAAALYLADWGATKQTRKSEMAAVLAYLCGTSQLTSRCRQAGGEYYQKLVIQKADWWQEEINKGISL